MLNKTKAALPGRLSHISNVAENNTTLLDQVNARRFAHISSNYVKSAQHLSAGGIPPSVTAAMARFLTVLQICSSLLAGGMRRWRSTQSPWFSGDLQSAENSADARLAEKPVDSKRWLWFGPQISTKGISSLEQNHGLKNQPFGSMSRDCSSLRIIRFIQAASDSSPSCRCASSIKSRSSGSSRNWNGGFPRLSFLCVDTFSTPDVVCLCVMTHYMHVNEKATPRSAETLPRRLTKPLFEVTVMAGSQHTQTHPKFTWRFLALSASARNVIHITATTEREARDQSPVGCVMVFAGRLPVHGG